MVSIMARKKQPPPKPTSMRLKDNHNWKAPDGYKIVVLDRGAVSFNVPQSWVVGKTQPFEMHDLPPPKDNVRLAITFWRTPPGVDWTGLPLAQMLEDATRESYKDTYERGKITKYMRSDIEIVWLQQGFIDEAEKRGAYSRIAMARGFDVAVLITLDYWVNESDKHKPTWNEVLRSLQLGRIIQDPKRGEVTH
jgi:hypothetical protein